jgi:hypothetical protein
MELNYFQINRAEYFVPIMVKIPGHELVLAKKGGAEHADRLHPGGEGRLWQYHRAGYARGTSGPGKSCPLTLSAVPALRHWQPWFW